MLETNIAYRRSEDRKFRRGMGVQLELEERPPQRAVSRILFPPPPLRAATGDDHSSSPAITGGIKQPTRRASDGPFCPPFADVLPYLALLRAGFCLPPMLPPARCALTAPFHPYLGSPSLAARVRAVYFLCHCPSSCPDRALPGALPCGVRTFLPPSPSRRGDHLALCDPPLSHRTPRPKPLAPVRTGYIGNRVDRIHG